MCKEDVKRPQSIRACSITINLAPENLFTWRGSKMGFWSPGVAPRGAEKNLSLGVENRSARHPTSRESRSVSRSRRMIGASFDSRSQVCRSCASRVVAAGMTMDASRRRQGRSAHRAGPKVRAMRRPGGASGRFKKWIPLSGSML